MAWFLISYNRPERAAQVIERIKEIGCSTLGVLFVNGGDIMRYQDIVLPTGWKLHNEQHNLGICGAMNRCLKLFPDEPFYGLITDDEWINTPGWDTKLAEAAGSWKIAHANDGWQSGARIHGLVTCGGDLIRECGFWALPGLWHWYVDNVWETLAHYCGLRVFCADVHTEHRHWMNRRAEVDKTYLSGEEKMKEDQNVFERWACDGSAEKLVNRIKEKTLADA